MKKKPKTSTAGLELRMENIEAAQESLRASHCVLRDELKREIARGAFITNCKGKDFDALALRVKMLERTKFSDSFAKRIEDLEEHRREMTKRLSNISFGGRYVGEQWVPDAKPDYYPTKRDIHALRSRVSGLNHREIEQALTQMLDRWEEMHG